MTEKAKTAPQSQESEMMVLGCMLTSVNALNIAAEQLDTDDFYFDQHKPVFTALKHTQKEAKPADIHLISEELKRQGKLETVGGISYLTTLAQFAGTSAFIEEYVRQVKDKSTLRRMIVAGQNLVNSALESPSDISSILDKCKEEIEGISAIQARDIPIPLMEDRLSTLEEKLKKLRGSKYLGLCQKTIPELDDNFLGLRKLIVLAAAPNVGKTALTNQFVVDVLKNHLDACVVYFSLEMTADDLLIRILCNQSELDYRTLVLGSDRKNGSLIKETFYSEPEMLSITSAETVLKSLKNRLQIVDKENCPFLTASRAIAHIDEVKRRTGCKRVFVVIDYLQVWPLNPQSKFFNENEIDKWRMEEAMKIRNAIDDDPIIVISEARKPQGTNKWGADLSDVMGAARMTYSPDAVLLFSQLNQDDLSDLWANDGKLTKTKTPSAPNKPSDSEIESLCKFLEKEGISICRLDMPKARDGMQKSSILIEFHYRKNVFKPANFPRIKAAMKSADRGAKIR